MLSEPKVTDRANNRISLTWDRPEKPETVLAYVVEAQSSEEQCWKQVPIIFHVRISKAKNAILNFFVFSTPLTQYITRFAYNEYARTRVGKTSIWHFFFGFFFYHFSGHSIDLKCISFIRFEISERNRIVENYVSKNVIFGYSYRLR